MYVFKLYIDADNLNRNEKRPIKLNYVLVFGYVQVITVYISYLGEKFIDLKLNKST
jgi:hypothetical protein